MQFVSSYDLVWAVQSVVGRNRDPLGKIGRGCPIFRGRRSALIGGQDFSAELTAANLDRRVLRLIFTNIR